MEGGLCGGDGVYGGKGDGERVFPLPVAGIDLYELVEERVGGVLFGCLLACAEQDEGEREEKPPSAPPIGGESNRIHRAWHVLFRFLPLAFGLFLFPSVFPLFCVVESRDVFLVEDVVLFWLAVLRFSAEGLWFLSLSVEVDYFEGSFGRDGGFVGEEVFVGGVGDASVEYVRFCVEEFVVGGVQGYFF